jgi:hypothetical protein
VPCQDSADQREKPDRSEPTLATEPTETTQASEATEPTDRNEPAEPTDKIDPDEPMDRIEPLEPMLRIDPDEPMLKIDVDVMTGRSRVPIGTFCRSRLRPGVAAVNGRSPPAAPATGANSLGGTQGAGTGTTVRSVQKGVLT